MVKPTDIEPYPILPPLDGVEIDFQYAGGFSLPAANALPPCRFGDVLEARRSAVGLSLSAEHLSDFLFHSMRKRRGGPGRFGRDWTGRGAPSAGGLHVLRLLILPMNSIDPLGIYDPESHCLLRPSISCGLVERNAKSVGELAAATTGTTIQFLAFPSDISRRYVNWESLLWRDSGALAATMGLVATALGMTCVVLGRTGRDVLEEEAWCSSAVAVGAVHLGAKA